MKRRMAWLYDGTLFLYVYLALTLLSFNPFVYYLPALRALTALAAVLGAASLVYRLFHFRRYQKAPCLWPAAAFLLSGLFTLAVNARYGVLESAQGLLWLAFQLLLLLPRGANEVRGDMVKELRGVGGVFVAYNAVMALLSLLMAFFGYGEVYRPGGAAIVPRGFVWGRLWGMYSDPNYGSASVCVSLAMCLFFLSRARTRRIRVLLWLSCLAFYGYIVFSDSRTGMAALAALLGAYALCRVYERAGTWGKKANGFKKRAALSILSAVLVSGLSISCVMATKVAYNSFISIVYRAEPGVPGENPVKPIDRAYDDQSDMSNGRLALWKSGVELFQKAPLFGVGFRNLQAAAKALVPDTYLVRNPKGYMYDAYHNMLVDVLASQGILGLIAFFALAVCALKHVFRLLASVLRRGARTALFAAALVSALAAVVAESLFISDLFYVNTPTSFMFWFLLGCLLRLGDDIGKENGAFVEARLEEWERAFK
ncbi:MAG: O-antigen ligase family protein [Clostridiaceae bacterium]|nr:O-antigen ligase family protein [Eubacteriales bacterium]